MSTLRVYKATVVQPDPGGDPIKLSDVRQLLLDTAPPQVFIVLGDGQTMLHPNDPERTYATGPCIVVVEGLYNRAGLNVNVLS